MKILFILCLLVVLSGLLVISGVIGLMILVGLIVATPFLILHYLKRRSLRATICGIVLVVAISAIIGIGIWWANKPSRPDSPADDESRALPHDALITTTRTEEWEWTWVTTKGEYIHGRQRNAPDETKAEIIPQANGDLYFDVPYVEYGSPQRERVRLGKVSENVWSGDRDQDRPRDHSRVELEMLAPGVYAGIITWPDGVMARCKLVRK